MRIKAKDLRAGHELLLEFPSGRKYVEIIATTYCLISPEYVMWESDDLEDVISPEKELEIKD